MRVIYDRNAQKLPIYSWCDDVEESALQQAIALSNHPCVRHHVALMPDVHTGMGMPIGGVVALQNAVCPSAVGVDIGCGMCAINTGYRTNICHRGVIKSIRAQMLRDIPVGFSHRSVDWDGPCRDVLDKLVSELMDKHPGIQTTHWIPWDEEDEIENKVRSQIGTLGGGNHFEQLSEDENGYVWAMIHSGSRNLGLRAAEYYDGQAKSLNAKWLSAAPLDLAFLPLDDQLGQDYVKDMEFALDFALANRRLMMHLIAYAFDRNKLGWPEDWESKMINIHHNYATMEHHFGDNLMVHRKGATLAQKGVMGIIPGSMGTNSYIVEGKGEPKSFTSCSHGAGRKMSRTEAKKKISMDSFSHKMKGIEYEPVKDNLDEAPQAYKDIEAVMDQQQDLVTITAKLKPIAVVKG